MQNLLQEARNGWQGDGSICTGSKQQVELFLCMLSSTAGLQCLQAATHIVTTVPPNGDFNQDPVSTARSQHLLQMKHELAFKMLTEETTIYKGHAQQVNGKDGNCSVNIVGKLLVKFCQI